MTTEAGKEYHLEVIDYLGNWLVCDEERWTDHIIGNRRHVDMEGLEDLVLEALQNPFSHIRYRDTDYPNRMSYYGSGLITRYIKVSVEFQDNNCTGNGVIKTAFPTNNMKPLEIPELPK